MRAVIQRVSQASVSVGSNTVSRIGRGLCCLIGIHRNDNEADIEYMVRKILNLRVFEGEDGKRWNKSVKDCNLDVLCVSQFTLYCELKGNKPDYRHAMGGDQAREFYYRFLDELKKNYQPDKIKDGEFGAMMTVDIANDGPVTINLDSPMKDKVAQKSDSACNSTEN